MTEAAVRLAGVVLPLVLLFVSLFFFRKKGNYTEAFFRGAREGIDVAVSLLPTLILLMVGVGLFRAGGVPDLLARLLSPLLDAFGIPAALVPLLLLRPLSGSGSQALLLDIFKTAGVDSFAGRAASVIMGAGETVFYVTAVYFSAVSVKKTRHTLPVALAASLVSVVLSIFFTRLFTQ